MGGGGGEYAGSNLNRGGGGDVECQNFDSVVCWQDHLSPKIFSVRPPIPGMSPTCVPIPVVRERCEKNTVPFVHYHFDVVWYSVFTKVKELL
jgi:hypothetical protein